MIEVDTIFIVLVMNNEDLLHSFIKPFSEKIVSTGMAARHVACFTGAVSTDIASFVRTKVISPTVGKLCFINSVPESELFFFRRFHGRESFLFRWGLMCCWCSQ